MKKWFIIDTYINTCMGTNQFVRFFLTLIAKTNFVVPIINGPTSLMAVMNSQVFLFHASRYFLKSSEKAFKNINVPTVFNTKLSKNKIRYLWFTIFLVFINIIFYMSIYRKKLTFQNLQNRILIIKVRSPVFKQ